MFVAPNSIPTGITSKSAPPGAQVTQTVEEVSTPVDEVQLQAETSEKSGLSKKGMVAAAIGLGAVALGLGATPAQAHQPCGISTSTSVVYDGWGAHTIQESFNSCNGQHIITKNGYVIHHDYHVVPRVPHHYYGGPQRNGAEEFLGGFLGGLIIGGILAN